MWNSRTGRLLRSVATIGLILFVCYKAGVFSESGRARFGALVAGADWFLVVASIIVAFVQNLVSVLKWRLVVVAKKLQGSMYRLLKFLYVGRLYNLILPSSMGGDVIRIYRLGQLNSSMERAAASVFVERFTGMLILLVLAAVSVMFTFRDAGELFVLSFGFVFAVSLFLGWAAIDARFADMLGSWANRFSSKLLGKVAEKFHGFQESIRGLGGNRRFLANITVYSVLFYALAILNVWVSALAFDRHVDLVDMIIAVPLIMLVMNLPVSIGGLGLMEASFTLGFEWLGYSAELGLTTALLMRAKTIIDALVGGAFEFGGSLRSTPSRPE